MLKRLPLKPDHLFLVGILLLAYLAYSLAFQKTWDAYQQHRQLIRQLASAADLTYQPGYLERKSLNLTHLVQGYRADSAVFRSQVLTAISRLSQQEQCSITEVPLTLGEGFKVEGYQLQRCSFKGSFSALTRLLHALEAAKEAGIVRAANYQLSKLSGGLGQHQELLLDVYLAKVN